MHHLNALLIPTQGGLQELFGSAKWISKSRSVLRSETRPENNYCGIIGFLTCLMAQVLPLEIYRI